MSANVIVGRTTEAVVDLNAGYLNLSVKYPLGKAVSGGTYWKMTHVTTANGPRRGGREIGARTTAPYDRACTSGYEEFEVHDGDGHVVYGGDLLYNPKVDDPVAQ